MWKWLNRWAVRWRSVRFLVALWEQIRRDEIFIRASGLAYASLLATVPLVAVLFSLYSAFGGFDELKIKVQEFLFSQFLPTRQDEIFAYINTFTANTGRLGFFGFAFLIVTSILLFDAIERNFNDIWHARERRSFLPKISAYTAVLVFGTLFMGASLSISATIKTRLFTGLLERTFIIRLMNWSLPLVLTLLGFLVLYLVIPNARVKFGSAAVGALIGGVLWEVGKNVFANSVGRSVNYSTIYGSLATIPIFLIWLYFTWLSLLIGLEIAFSHQHWRKLERDLMQRRKVEQGLLGLGLKILTLVSERFRDGGQPPTDEELAEAFDASGERVERCLTRLQEGKVLHRLADAENEGGFIPARDPARLKLTEIIRLLLAPGAGGARGERPFERQVEEEVEAFCAAGERALEDRSVSDLLSPRQA